MKAGLYAGAIIFLFQTSLALALDERATGKVTNSNVVEPSKFSAPLPAAPAPAQAPEASRSNIPQLPVSEKCKPDDVRGLWKLKQVFEDPSGVESAAFQVSPVQYLFFKADGFYGKYNGASIAMPANIIKDEIKKHSTGLQQYLVQDGGYIYYYQDKVAVDLHVCFIVSESKNMFEKDDMILMPPKGQIKGRLIKLYTRATPKPAPKNDAAQQMKVYQQMPAPQQQPPSPVQVPPPQVQK